MKLRWNRSILVFILCSQLVATAFGAEQNTSSASSEKLDHVLELFNSWKKAHPSVSRRTLATAGGFETEEIYLTDGVSWKSVTKTRKPIVLDSVEFPSDRDHKVLVYLPKIDKTMVVKDEVPVKWFDILDWRAEVTRPRLEEFHCGVQLVHDSAPYDLEFCLTNSAAATNSLYESVVHYVLDGSGKLTSVRMKVLNEDMVGEVEFLTFDSNDISQQMKRIHVNPVVDYAADYNKTVEELVIKMMRLDVKMPETPPQTR